MEGVYFERKCHYIGMWKDDTVADNIIRQVASMVRSGKGTKCKLLLSIDGIKITTSSIMAGKNLKDRENFDNIYFATVNQYNPQCLLFIVKDPKRKYRIIAIRCESSNDAALFVSCFKDLRKSLKTNNSGSSLELRQIESGNWTLRSKHHDNDKRQLNNIVKMNGEKTNVHLKQNGVIRLKQTDINSNVKIMVKPNTNEKTDNANSNNAKNGESVDNKNANTIGIQTELGGENGHDDVTNGITSKDDSDHLSNEMLEMKHMLETSTGIGADVYHDKDKNEVEFNQKSSAPEVRIETEVVEPTSPISAVVFDDDSSENDSENNNKNDSENINNKQTNGVNGLNESNAKESVNSNDSVVKVIVPDYRSSGTQTSTKYVRRYIPKDNNNTLIYNGKEEPKSPRLTTSFDQWRDDVVIRKKIVPRQQRPRSAYLSTSSTGSSLEGSLRDRNPHVIYATTSRSHHSLPHHSLRIPVRRPSNISSTIARPIEKVYPRPKSVHGSIVYRPVSSNQRKTIYAIPTTPRKVYVGSNHDKVEINGQRKSGSIIQQKVGEKDVIIKT